MSALAQLLAQGNAYDAYGRQVGENQTRTLRDVQTAAGQMGILAQIAAQARAAQTAPMQAELMRAQVGEHQAKAAKMKQEAEFNARLMQSGGVDALTPDQLDAFAAKAGIMGHPGVVGLAQLAQARRAKLAQEQALGGMRSQVVANAPAETEAQAIERVQAATAAGQPASVGFGENPNVIPRKEGGIADYLASSPYVGAAAKQLQARIDSGAIGLTPKDIETRIANLDKMHTTMTEARGVRDDKKAGMQERASASGGSAEVTPGDFTKQGNEFLESLPETDRQMVRKIAGYEIDPKTLSTRGGHRERVLSMVSQFDPTYDDTQYANKRRAIAQFGSGPQGNTVRSLNVAIEHIDTLQRAADALKNGDFTPGNKTYNEFAKIFGQSPPNTFEGIRDFVANEVVKGTIGNAGALQDRNEAQSRVKAAASPEQLNQLMNGWTELMGGQVKGLAQQYEGSTGLKDFRDRYLTQRTRDAIALAEGKATPPTASAKIPEFATEADAAKAGLKPGTKIKIGGRPGTWQ